MSAKDIRKAYLRQCRAHHPDKGGDARAFCHVTEAHAILRDPRTRRAYDALLLHTAHLVTVTLLDVYRGSAVRLERDGLFVDIRIPRGAREATVVRARPVAHGRI